MANEQLGTIECRDCGGTAGVFQAKRKGAHLYERCFDCGGLNQSTSAPYQTRLYYGSNWSGETPVKPSNVKDEPPEPAKPIGLEPEPEPIPEPEPEPKPKPKGDEGEDSSGLGWLAAGAGLLALLLKGF